MISRFCFNRKILTCSSKIFLNSFTYITTHDGHGLHDSSKLIVRGVIHQTIFLFNWFNLLEEKTAMAIIYESQPCRKIHGHHICNQTVKQISSKPWCWEQRKPCWLRSLVCYHSILLLVKIWISRWRV